MKLLSSSTSSASSTISTTTSTNFFDGNFYAPKNAAAGCISGVIRRLLCRSSLPTHPADHFREAESEAAEAQKLKCSDVEDEIEALGTPSIVARLMGLESMPQVDFATAGRKSPNSLARSRSMNSAESSKDLELIQGRHRRVKSFREIPTYVELEDDKFFILSFENGHRSRKMASKGRKPDKGRRHSEQRSEEKHLDCGKTKRSRESNGRNKAKRREDSYENNKENFCNVINNEKEKKIVVCDDVLKDASNVLRPVKNDSGKNSGVKLSEPASHMENSEERRRIKKKSEDDCLDVKMVGQELDSQNSSPNSVLDFPVDREAPSSAEVSKVTISKSRRTLWEELENYRKLNPCRDKGVNSSNGGPKASLSANSVRMPLLQNKVYQGHKHVQTMWRQICKLADRETLKPNWIREENLKLEHNKRISRDLELAILDQVVEELVYQLAANCILKF